MQASFFPQEIPGLDDAPRSGCPINLAVEVLGDHWSLIVVRDIVFGGRRHFRELLTRSDEGIASNMLADRLKRLLAAGILSRRDDPSHSQKAIYSLTEKGIDLVPVLAALGAWGRRWLPVGAAMSVRARVLDEGGPAMWRQFMDELRAEHLGTPPRRGRKRWTPSVRAVLQQAYQDAVQT